MNEYSMDVVKWHQLPNGDIIRIATKYSDGSIKGPDGCPRRIWLYVSPQERGEKWYLAKADDIKVIKEVCGSASEVKQHMEGYTL